jgi:Zn-dependent peptidase ImmA (M78 family)/predicted secreted protein
VARSWPDIHRAAYVEAMRAHRELDVDPTRPVDPFGALARSGVVVLRRRLDGLAGAYIPADTAEGTAAGVLVNVAHPPSRQRFTAAHELAHHRRDADVILDADTEWLARGETTGLPERERFAEAFAAWFLMPRGLVDRTLARLALAPERLDEQGAYALALELGTSYAATVRHLSDMGLVGRPQQDRLLRTTPQAIKQALGALDAAADAWRDVRLVTPDRRPREVGALEGDALVLDVPEVPSSGYLWRPVGLPGIVAFVRDEYRDPGPEVLGGEGRHRFVFRVQGPGHETIRLELGRPWQQDATVETRSVELLAEPRPGAGLVHPSMLVGAAA